MKKHYLLSLLLASSAFAFDYNQMDKAFEELDCEFKDCNEKKPVIIYKEKIVEKPVEKIIYKERIVEKPVYKEPAPVIKKEVAVDGRYNNKAFIDFYLDNQEKIYQYVSFSNNSFNLNDRKLIKVFDLYKKRDLKKAKFVISGKIELPKNTNPNTVFIVEGVTSHDWSEASRRYNRSDYLDYGWQLFINGKAHNKHRSTVGAIQKNAQGNPYLDIRVEALANDNYHNKTSVYEYIERIKQGVEKLSFFAEFSTQAKRGEAASISKQPLTIYCEE